MLEYLVLPRRPRFSRRNAASVALRLPSSGCRRTDRRKIGSAAIISRRCDKSGDAFSLLHLRQTRACGPGTQGLSVPPDAPFLFFLPHYPASLQALERRTLHRGLSGYVHAPQYHGRPSRNPRKTTSLAKLQELQSAACASNTRRTSSGSPFARVLAMMFAR